MCLGSVFAQTQDELLKAIEDAENDSLRVYAMRDLVIFLFDTSFEDALQIAIEAEELAKKTNDGEALTRIMLVKGLALEGLDSLQAALKTYDDAIVFALRADDHLMRGKLLASKGSACHFAGDYGRALEYYSEALEILRETNDTENESKVLNNMGVLLRNAGDYQSAIETYHRSLEIKTLANDGAGIANTHLNLGLAHSYLDQDSLTFYHFEEALQGYLSLNDQTNAALVKNSIGLALYNSDRKEEALPYLRECHDILSQKKNLDYVTHILVLGLTLHDLGFEEEGTPYLTEAYNYVTASNQRRSLLKNVELTMYKIRKNEGNIGEALVHLENYKAINDSLSNERKDRIFREMQSKFELREKENEILKQQLQIEQATKQRTLLAGGVLLFLLLAASGTLFGFHKLRSNRLLSKQKSIIERSLSERELMLREIHHRVKNNLQIISGLLSIQSIGITDSAARDAINISRSRVRSMSLLHQNLYREDEKVTSVEMPSYISRLSKEVIDTMGDEDIDISYELEVELDELDVDVAIPVGLILNELITNAAKYAFIDREEGNIHIRLVESEDVIQLTVKDDGVGLQGEQHSESFGQRMIQSLGESLDAKVIYHSEPNNGLCVSISIPKKTKRA